MQREISFKQLYLNATDYIGDAITCFDKVFYTFGSMGEEVDYKKLYCLAMKQMEDVINILIAAQQSCEEMYIDIVEK